MYVFYDVAIHCTDITGIGKMQSSTFVIITAAVDVFEKNKKKTLNGHV